MVVWLCSGVTCGEFCALLHIPGSGQSGFGRSVDAGVLPGLKYSRTRRQKMDGRRANVQLARSWGPRYERSSCSRRGSTLALRTTVTVNPGSGAENERPAVTEDCRTTSMTLSVYCATIMSAIDAPILDSRTLPVVPATDQVRNCSHNNSPGA